MSEHLVAGPIIVSELVTNAVEHAQGDIDVFLAENARSLRIAVRDRNAAPPVTPPLDVESFGAGTADRAGTIPVDRRPSRRWRGKLIWAVLEAEATSCQRANRAGRTSVNRRRHAVRHDQGPDRARARRPYGARRGVALPAHGWAPDAAVAPPRAHPHHHRTPLGLPRTVLLQYFPMVGTWLWSPPMAACPGTRSGTSTSQQTPRRSWRSRAGRCECAPRNARRGRRAAVGAGAGHGA